MSMKKVCVLALVLLAATYSCFAQDWWSMSRADFHAEYGTPIRSTEEFDVYLLSVYTDEDTVHFYFFSWGGLEAISVMTAGYRFKSIIIDTCKLYGPWDADSTISGGYTWTKDDLTLNVSYYDGISRIFITKKGPGM